MRPFLLIPALVIVPFAMVHLLKSITGDPLSAVVLGLTIFITVAAWFAGPSASAGYRGRRTQAMTGRGLAANAGPERIAAPAADR